MKIQSIIIALCLITGIHSVYGQEYVLDTKKSEPITWKGYGEAGDFTQQGTIKVKSSKISMDEEGKLSGDITIDMRSISHDDEGLVEHLKNEDFFDVKKYPIATLSFVRDAENTVSGELTLKDTKGRLKFHPEITQEENKIIVSGTAEIDRTIYGIKYNSSSFFQDLGSYAIKNNFDISFQLEYVLEE